MAEGQQYYAGKKVTVLVNDIRTNTVIPYSGEIVKVGRKYLTITYRNDTFSAQRTFSIDSRRSTDKYSEACFKDVEEACLYLEKIALLEELRELGEVIVPDARTWTNEQLADLILAVVKIRKPEES